MARIKEDPSLKHILDEIENGGPAVMMRFIYHFLKKKIIFYGFSISTIICYVNWQIVSEEILFIQILE